MLKIAYSSCYQHPVPEGHKFPMAKYELLPKQLIHQGIVEPDNFFEPNIEIEKAILTTHAAEYLNALKQLQLDGKAQRKIGFKLSQALVKRELVILQGTVQNALYAIKYGCSVNVAGGTHHAFSNKGEGFCLLNDMAVAAHYLLQNKWSSKILIVDLDVHQGNGTAEIFKNVSQVFTFSMHGASNYPLVKEISDLDVPLPNGTTDLEYLDLLRQHLKELIKTVNPDFIFYQAGVDVLATDKLGKLNLTIEGCKKRDQIVLKACFENQIPVAISMGGGYSENLGHILDAHVNTFRVVQDVFF